jgi:hypothetical protein
MGMGMLSPISVQVSALREDVDAFRRSV